jgi:thiol-disulfide isomerase/thioredoxin
LEVSGVDERAGSPRPVHQQGVPDAADRPTSPQRPIPGRAGEATSVAAGVGTPTGAPPTDAAATSGTAKSGSAKSGTAKSGSAKSGTAKSGSAKSGTAKSGSAKSGTAKSGYVLYARYRADPAGYADGRVVLFFHAKWCPDCRRTEDNLTSDPASIPKDLTVVQVDFDTQDALRSRYGVTQQWTFVSVDSEGAELKKWTGTDTGAEIAAQAV